MTNWKHNTVRQRLRMDVYFHKSSSYHGGSFMSTVPNVKAWALKLPQLITSICKYGRGSTRIHPRHGNAERNPNIQTNLGPAHLVGPRLEGFVLEDLLRRGEAGHVRCDASLLYGKLSSAIQLTMAHLYH